MLEMTEPRLRALLESNRGVELTWLSLGNLPILESAIEAGAQTIVIDAQHGLWDRHAIEVAAMIAGRTIPLIVRVAENAGLAIGEALDTGAEGVMVPLVETAAEAAEAVAAAHFPPFGRRSGGGIRPVSSGFAAYAAAARRRTVVGVMIETREGLRNVASIAATPGLDFVLIGTGDLGLSLESAAGDESTLDTACDAILAACRAARLPCGIFTLDAGQARRRRAEGYDLVVVASDVLLVNRAFRSAIEEFQVS
jgi:2-dehydro-3-deoxyglucarate aldolase/4-hydroxy-2-oxoheptanedioate aldolase